VDIDLAALTRGFTNNSPKYLVFSAVNGTVVTNGNGKTARFTSSVNTNALGSFTYTVTDANGYNMTQTVGIRIIQPTANTAPVFVSSAADRFINVGVNLSITNVATDVNVPLTYSLTGKPANATYNPNTGVFNWRPQVTQADTTNAMTVIATDNGTPFMMATQNFRVIVNPLALPVVTTTPVTIGQIGLTVSGQLGPDYAVQGSSNLVDWNTLWITNPAVMPFSWSTNTGSLPQQYYRIKVGPPLP
jgi:hypothetical protein